MKNKKLYIDIFAGCGGLSAGLMSAGWNGIFAVEKNIDAFSTLKKNLIDKSNHFTWPTWLPMKEFDINELMKEYADELRSMRGKVSLVAGGPPCQGFSMAGKRDENDVRNNLVKSYIEFIRLVQPESILFENVYGFTTSFKDKEKTREYSSYIEDALKKQGYNVAHKMVNTAEYGVPQKRKRFILIATKNHNPVDVFSKLEINKERFFNERGISQNTTIKEAIGDLQKQHGALPSPDSKGFKAGMYGKIESGYQKLMRVKTANMKATVDSHRFVNHREDTIKLHEDLIKFAPIGKRITPTDNIIMNLNRRGVTVLDANGQSPTITSIPDELVHFSEPRILTVREHARIQSFPDWYEFTGKYTSGGQRRKFEVPRYTQVGNAVPPLFAEQLGIALLEVLEK